MDYDLSSSDDDDPDEDGLQVMVNESEASQVALRFKMPMAVYRLERIVEPRLTFVTSFARTGEEPETTDITNGKRKIRRPVAPPKG